MSIHRARQVAQRFDVDRAVAYAVAARGWQLLTGQVTALLIMFCLTKVEQGYYYAFVWLLGMQIFVELGLHVVIINVASHEWSELKSVDGEVEGSPRALSRLASLNRIAVRWYLFAAGIFVVAVSVAGVVYFSGTAVSAEFVTDAESSTVRWFSPWLVLVFLTGLQLGLLPITSILEGCGQLPTINQFRFWQGMAGSFVVWSLLFVGFGVWALCGSAAVRLIGEAYLALGRYRKFFVTLRDQPATDVVDWKSEVVPLQWRIAVQGAFHWFATHLAGLVLFKEYGPAVAGQFGLMWTVLTAIQGAATSWIDTRRPVFGRLIAERNYSELDRRFFSLCRISIGLVVAGTLLFTVGVVVVNQFSNWFFDKIALKLPDVQTVLTYSLGFIAFQPAVCANIYVRAHKKDPFLLASIISNSAIAGLTVSLGTIYGIVGLVSGYLIGVAGILTPLWVGIWWVTRQRWHAVDDSGSLTALASQEEGL